MVMCVCVWRMCFFWLSFRYIDRESHNNWGKGNFFLFSTHCQFCMNFTTFIRCDLSWIWRIFQECKFNRNNIIKKVNVIHHYVIIYLYIKTTTITHHFIVCHHLYLSHRFPNRIESIFIFPLSTLTLYTRRKSFSWFWYLKKISDIKISFYCSLAIFCDDDHHHHHHDLWFILNMTIKTIEWSKSEFEFHNHPLISLFLWCLLLE